MRRSASANADCSAAGAHTVTAKPDRLARSATAIATGLPPQITTCGRGSTGSTKISMVPWLGHMFLAKRTPPAGFVPLAVQHITRRHGHEARFAVGERILCRFQHRRARAAAADPALRD